MSEPHITVWQHFAFIFTSTSFDLYIDGVLTNSSLTKIISYSGIPMVDRSLSYIGRASNNDNFQYWGGYMADFKIFNYALNQGEILQLLHSILIKPFIQWTSTDIEQFYD